MSIALAHKRRVLALGPAAAAAAEPYSSSTALASPANAQKHLKLMEGALAIDLARLSDMNNLAGRQQLKRDELLPKYMDYVERYRDSGLNHPNLVLVQVMVWLFDTEQFELGLEVAMFAIEQGQSMPERFKRDIPTFVGDAVIEWADNEQKCGRSPEPYLSDMLPFVDGEWDLTEQIPAKYHKLIGIRAMDAKDWKKAISHFERATELYASIGVDTRLKGARKALEKQLAEPAAE
ncbi:terminase [Pseudomonas sp. ADAK2]|uniref:phage terminase small subunit n=1 Tax=unclassified Pseudomonas TaxID=196821 RepID=UPI0014630227|nr:MULTISPECIES: phage terminase small subunit [unclassified Pseudomonas]QJI41431.1 terminase [Pseudomonas sp. ADAK7]QJI47735.1 terminase [Pseudomonas sp. ADAK2]